jgi:hypothetical protein
MRISRQQLRKRFNQIACYCIQKMQRRQNLDSEKRCLTIFHDYESDYALPDKAEASYYGVNRILEIEKIQNQCNI